MKGVVVEENCIILTTIQFPIDTIPPGVNQFDDKDSMIKQTAFQLATRFGWHVVDIHKFFAWRQTGD